MKRRILYFLSFVLLLITISQATASTPYPESTDPFGASIVFHFDNATGTTPALIVESLYGDNGSATNIATDDQITSMGNFSEAMQTDGSTSYINTDWGPSDFNTCDAVTISFWLKTTDTTNDATLIGSDDTAGERNYFYINNRGFSGKMLLVFQGDNQWAWDFMDWDSNVATGAWHHLALVKGQGCTYGTQFDIYFNGVNQSRTDVGSVDPLSGSALTYAPFMGAISSDGSPGQYLESAYDDFLVFNKTLTNSEILTIYNGNYTAPPPAPGSLNISSASPTNGTQTNFNTVHFNVTVNSSFNFNASLWINGAVNQTLLNQASGTDVLADFNLSFDSTTELTLNYSIEVYNNETGKNTTNITLFVDRVDPSVTIEGDLSTNLHVNYGERNITSTFYLNDSNVWGLNISLNGTYSLEYMEDINSNLTYLLSFNPSTFNLNEGVYNVEVWVSDSHTAKEIPLYDYTKGLIENSIRYDFNNEGGWIKVKPLKSKLFTGFNTWKEKDRYVFSIDRNPLEKALFGSEIEFQVTSSDPLKYVSNSKYKGHIVSPNLKKWIDFETEFPDAKVTVERVDERTLNVLLEGIEEEDFIIRSIGGLNVVNQNYSFYYGNISETFINQSLETGDNLFTLNFTTNSTYVNGISATLFYNETSYTPTKVTGSNYVYFYHTVDTPLLSSGNVTNNTFFWNYTVTAVDLNNVSNETTHSNQTVYKMIVTNCTGGFVTTRSYNFSTVSFTNGSDVNTSSQTIATVWNRTSSVSRTYSFSKDNSFWHTICIYPEWSTINTNLEGEFSATGFDNTQYILTGGTLSNSLVQETIYMSQTGDTTAITITVVDENDDVLNDYTIQAFRYDISTNNYTLVNTKITNPEGKALFNLDVSSYDYQFVILNSEGTTVYTEPKQELIETSYTFRVVLGTSPESIQLKLLPLPYDLAVNEDNNTFALSWDDTQTELINSINMTIVLLNTSGDVVIFSQTSTSDMSSMSQNVSANGIYAASVYVTSSDDGNVYFLDSVTLDIRAVFDVFGLDSLIMAILFMGTMSFLGLYYSIEASVIFTILGTLMSYFMGFMMVSLSGIISLIIVLIVAMVRIQR